MKAALLSKEILKLMKRKLQKNQKIMSSEVIGDGQL